MPFTTSPLPNFCIRTFALAAKELGQGRARGLPSEHRQEAVTREEYRVCVQWTRVSAAAELIS